MSSRPDKENEMMMDVDMASVEAYETDGGILPPRSSRPTKFDTELVKDIPEDDPEDEDYNLDDDDDMDEDDSEDSEME